MFNKSGVRKQVLSGPVQILANANLQVSVGCIVSSAISVTPDQFGRKIVKAGTPINMDFLNQSTVAVLATASVAMKAVLLHNVDITDGNANGTALVFGFVNLNRVDTTVQTQITTALTNATATKQVTFLRM